VCVDLYFDQRKEKKNINNTPSKFELLTPAAGKKKRKEKRKKKEHGMELKLEACSFLWQQPPLFKGGLETLKIQFAPK